MYPIQMSGGGKEGEEEIAAGVDLSEPSWALKGSA